MSAGLEGDAEGNLLGMTEANADKIKGRLKEAAGDLTDNDELKREGQTDQTAGKAKQHIDAAADKARDVVDGVKEKLRRD